MNPHRDGFLRRAAALRERAADLQTQIATLRQQVAADIAEALAWQCRAGAQPETHSPKPTKAKP